VENTKQKKEARDVAFVLGGVFLLIVAAVGFAVWAVQKVDPSADDIIKEFLRIAGLVATFTLGQWIGHAKHADKDHTESYHYLVGFAVVLALIILGIYGWSKLSKDTSVSSASTEALHQMGSLVALVTGHHVGTRNKSARP
jgi:flagellar biogenesis protein FliO